VCPSTTCYCACFPGPVGHLPTSGCSSLLRSFWSLRASSLYPGQLSWTRWRPLGVPEWRYHSSAFLPSLLQLHHRGTLFSAWFMFAGLRGVRGLTVVFAGPSWEHSLPSGTLWPLGRHSKPSPFYSAAAAAFRAPPSPSPGACSWSCPGSTALRGSPSPTAAVCGSPA